MSYRIEWMPSALKEWIWKERTKGGLTVEIKMAEYFKVKVLKIRKIKLSWILSTINEPEHTERQDNGRTRFWKYNWRCYLEERSWPEWERLVDRRVPPNSAPVRLFYFNR